VTFQSTVRIIPQNIYKKDLHQRLETSEMLRCCVAWIFRDVSKDRNSWPWRWRHKDSLKNQGTIYPRTERSTAEVLTFRKTAAGTPNLASFRNPEKKIGAAVACRTLQTDTADINRNPSNTMCEFTYQA